MDRQKLVRQFVAEAMEHLSRIEHHLLALEKAPDDLSHVHDIFQAIHGIKGTSDYVQLASITRLSHEIETLLNRIRKGALPIGPAVVDKILQGIDLLKDCVAHPDRPDHRADDIRVYTDQIGSFAPQGETPAPQSETGRLGEDVLMHAFREAARQHIEALRMVYEDLRDGRASPNTTAALRRILRTFHNSANYLGLDEITCRIVAMQATHGQASELTAEAFATLPRDLDALEDEVNRLAPPAAPTEESFSPAVQPPETAAPAEPVSEADDTLRVSMSKLDEFMNVVSDLVLVKNAVAHLADIARSEAVSGSFARQLQTVSAQLSKTTDILHNRVMAVRLVRVGTLFDRFPRLVRDLARAEGKKARLVTLGGDTEVDKGVADLLSDPLMHLLRNAIGHGLEDGERRRSLGKAAMGTVTLKAEQEAGLISVEVIDDGRGFDPEQIAQVAIREGVVSAQEAAAMSPHELVSLVFRPGFSTTATVDPLSGRGVGLDVVNTFATRVGGNIQVEWEPGKGSVVRLRIPLTLAVIQTLVVEVGGHRFAVPTSFIAENLRVSDADVTWLNGVRTIVHKDEAIPLLKLGTLLGLPSADDLTEPMAVLIDHGVKRFGLLVDRIVVQQDALIRPLDPQLSRLKQFSGATVMSDGSLVLILNPAGLASSSRSGEP